LQAKDLRKQVQVIGTLFFDISEVLERACSTKFGMRQAFHVPANYRRDSEDPFIALSVSSAYRTLDKVIQKLWEANDLVVDAARSIGVSHVYRIRREKTGKRPPHTRKVSVSIEPTAPAAALLQIVGEQVGREVASEKTATA
jgi:hypothetical protein